MITEQDIRLEYKLATGYEPKTNQLKKCECPECEAEFEEEFPESDFDKWIMDKYLSLRNLIPKLEHYRDTTLGLHCTDRPDLVNDPKKIMFKLE